MPFIKIQSNPWNEKVDIPLVIKNIGEEFSRSTQIGIEHITVTWETFSPHHYLFAGKTVAQQEASHHPLLVELFIPDFNSKTTIGLMLTTIADSMTKHVPIKSEQVFIRCSLAASGMIYDKGQVGEW